MEKSDHSVHGEADWGRILRYNNMVLNGQDEFPCPLESSKQEFEQIEPESPPPCPQWSAPSMTKMRALEVLRKHVSDYGLDPRPANEAQVTNMEILQGYRYRLESFTEKRVTRWNTEPYKGEELDDSGVPPPPWSVPAEEPPQFTTSFKDIPLPYTSLIKDCGRCLGRGRIACTSCENGRDKCAHCCGRGYNYNYVSTYTLTNHCYMCSGMGHVRCMFCRGMGESRCLVCMEHKKTTLSICLRVKWVNHQNQILCGSKEAHLHQLSGRTLLTHTAKRVRALTDFPESGVMDAAQRFTQKHAQEYTDNARILQQRQRVELVWMCRVSYTWRDQTYQFYVPGEEEGAIVDNYPEVTCDCCSVM
ncbi:hypothetical protein NL108_016192 [Boleophthalmus pectinirostris]|uniref:protein SSUH2 homolog n=1 Tax=Boleophthalmus pectinirostris TaxID=150288 RepID=UPI00242C34E5|nr:protein SSUH2 homolog [Boleophthalmus pectinirostris]KAJ0037130.1 hypothetical protein NL108_016192 [Boleophthalmus pectinirostris]